MFVSDEIQTENVSDPDRFHRVVCRFDEENARDPHRETDGGIAWPRELLLARRLWDWVLRLAPDPSEELRLASRCQHLCRWMIARPTYAMTKAGYLQWRADLKVFHAHLAGEILRTAGYPDDLVFRVQMLNLKTNFPTDPEACLLEDALCLVFLQYQFAELAARTDAAKIINALQKSWKKMTPAAHAEALRLRYGPRETKLLEAALGQRRAPPGATSPERDTSPSAEG